MGNDDWAGKTVLVLGLGDTGLSCVRWLAEKGARLRGADTRQAPPALGAVLEALSVIVQVGSFKLTGKRVFRMAPLHHHYELKGWKENQVVVRFWIITMMLVLFGLSTLKLR